jgi:hypothetical protein
VKIAKRFFYIFVVSKVKSISNIILAVLFVLPTLGVHIDLTHCCGGLEKIGFTHSVNVSVSECCDAELMEECIQMSEIIMSPTQFDYTIILPLHAPVAPLCELPHSVAVGSLYISKVTYNLTENSTLKQQKPLSLYQVFLC